MSRILALILPELIRAPITPAQRQRIINAYGEAWRHYHSTTHILTLRDQLHTISTPELNEVQYATLTRILIYHDVWYKVGRERGENERKSAEWACNDLSPHLSEIELRGVEQGILATIDHTLDAVDTQYHAEVGLFLDLDLMGLGQSPDGFDQDTEEVWEEYRPIATRQEYDTGRRAWATQFLARERLYHTSHFAHLEAQARRNLEALSR